MCKFNIMDIHAIQECLVAYKNLVDWMPVTCVEEMDLKDERLKVIGYLSDKCDEALASAEEEGRYE